MKLINEHPIFIDYTTFMGMHSADECVQKQSLAFFSMHFKQQIYMNYEQVGICDNIVWAYSRSDQDKYYPFMDRLHSEMDIKRVGYQYGDVSYVLSDQQLVELNVSQAMLIAQVVNNNGVLYTHDSKIRELDCYRDYLGAFPELDYLDSRDRYFDCELDSYFKDSLVLSVQTVL